MAHHKSAKKRIRQTVTKTLRNKIQISETRTAIKAIQVAITEGKKEEASKMLPHLQSLFGKLQQKGILKKNTAARRTSRLVKQVTKL